MSLIDIHSILSRAVAIYSLAMTLFALYRYLRREPIGSDYRGAILVGEGLIVVQGVLGGIMFFMGLRPANNLHFIYGGLTLLTWPAAFSFARNQEDERKETMVWMVASLILFAASLRALATGS